MAGDGDDSAHAGAEGEAAVRGQVADIQHRVAQEQRKNGQGVNEAEFKRGLAEAEGSGKSHGNNSFKVKSLKFKVQRFRQSSKFKV